MLTGRYQGFPVKTQMVSTSDDSSNTYYYELTLTPFPIRRSSRASSAYWWR
jgi:hypothetical protein